jgi:hypothetical protein
VTTSATFSVRVVAGEGSEVDHFVEALLEVPEVPDADVARLVIRSDGALEDADALLVVAPADRAAADATGKPVFDVSRGDEARVAGESGTSFVVGPALEGVELVRAALLDAALRSLGVPVDRARRAKRPAAAAIIAGAAAVAGLEGVLPGAAAFVLATQVSAIASLHYLYTGKWMGRTQTLAVLPVFVTDAAGGSIFLLLKSVLPPTGVADVAAAVVAATMTIAVLGAIARVLDAGYALDEKEKLRVAFERMRARTKAERAALVRERHRWRDKGFFRDLVLRLVFE